MVMPEDILAFWFPPGLDADEDTHRRQFQFWFGGGANPEIARAFAGTHEAAARGALDSWADNARGRLALIIVLDQFSRSLHGGSARAYAQDDKAIALALDGLARGFYRQLATAWEKTFFVLPLGHAEQLAHLDRCIALADALIPQAPPQVRRLYEFSASQARGHRDVLARFGRQPHRNAALGRASTAEEQAYLAAGDFVHRRSFAG
jgi:uncharacterized protein (DUF924 family)